MWGELPAGRKPKPLIAVNLGSMTETTYSVTGMTCDHCVRAVLSEVGKVPGVAEVAVDLAAGRVTVQSEGPVDPAAVRAAVEEAGFELTA